MYVAKCLFISACIDRLCTQTYVGTSLASTVSEEGTQEIEESENKGNKTKHPVTILYVRMYIRIY